MQNKKITVQNLEHTVWAARTLAELGQGIDETTRISLLGDGFSTPAHRAKNCLGWIWCQWLSESPAQTIRKEVEPFIETGLEMRALCRSWHKRSQHDLFLLHCAIFASNADQLKRVAEVVADSSGEKGDTPADSGELYAAAWCGLMKYWILGDDQKALEEFNHIWGAYRDQQVLASPKPLALPWLKRDWKTFVDRQNKEFEKRWSRARKDATVRSETEHEIVVRTSGYQIGHMWCWSLCGMALLAHRQGVEVATDPLWFPAHALKCVDAK